MRKLSLLIVTTLLLSSCSTGEKIPTLVLGDIPSCDQIDTSKVTKKTLQMNCLDGSSNINFHSIKGPLIINVWASWCEGCKEEMPYFIDLYANPVFKNGEIKLLGIDVDGRSKIIFGPGVPVTYFLDKNGEVIHKHIGAFLSKAQLYEAVEKYFEVKL